MPVWSAAVVPAATGLAGDVTAIDAAAAAAARRSWWAQEMAERRLMVGTDTSWREFAYCWTA